MLTDHMSEDFWKLGPNLTMTQREYGPGMYFFFSVLKKGQWFEDCFFLLVSLMLVQMKQMANWSVLNSTAG